MEDRIIECLKSIELDMLNSFIECCIKLGIRYYMLGGSMLGAVRHQGFIPWDDDIDVGLLRNDYELFVEKGQQYLPSFYFIQNYKTDPDCMLSITKIRDSRTTFIETSYKYKDMNHGIFIDVFPLDYYPESEKEQSRLNRIKKLIGYRLYRDYNIPKQNRNHWLLETAKRSIGTLLILKYPSVTAALEAQEKLYKSQPRSEYIANYSGAWGKKEIVPAEWYGEGVYANFEGLKVLIPKEYDKWLQQVYGNYLELPPLEKRVSHHYTEIIDPYKPYKDYRQYYGPQKVVSKKHFT